MVRTFCTINFLEFIVSGKKVGPIILVALTAHHAPNLTSRNGRSGITLRLGYRQKDGRIYTAIDKFTHIPKKFTNIPTFLEL